MKRDTGISEVGNEKLGFKRFRSLDGIDENCWNFGSTGGRNEKGFTKDGEVGVGVMDENNFSIWNNISHSSAMDSSCPLVNHENRLDFDINLDSFFDVGKGENKFDFDMNLPSAPNFAINNGGMEMAFQEYTKDKPAISERRVDIIDLSSDESDDDVEIIACKNNNVDKGKQVEVSILDDSVENLKLELSMMGMKNIGGESSLTGGGEKRYTWEEKGKAPVVNSWLSVGPNHSVDLDPSEETEGLFDLNQSWQDLYLLSSTSMELSEEQPPALAVTDERAAIPIRPPALVGMNESAAIPIRPPPISLRRAKRLARVDYLTEDLRNGSPSQEKKLPPSEVDVQLGNSPGPFSDALKKIRERNDKLRFGKLIEWKPAEESHGRSVTVPSLLDLSLRALAENAEGLVLLEFVPDMLRRRLTDLLCDKRKMDLHILDLLVKGCPTEIRIKNCSWLTDTQFTQAFQKCDTKCLRVLQLDLCGQCTLDYAFSDAFAQSPNRLQNLAILSLRGACRLTDEGLKKIVMSAPALQSISLGQCTLLTSDGINFLAESLGPILRELYIDDCQKIDAMLITSSLKNFENLEVLSVAGIPTVSDQFVHDMITVCGRNIKELDLANCVNLTDRSLQIIGSICSDLRALNISYLPNLTDLGIEYLANGCSTIKKLKLTRNRFSDETMAAFLETSGEFLEELLLNNVTKVGPNTALVLAKRSRKLVSLDLSWCREITNEALGLIVDSCSSLKLVKVFGCTQITDLFVNGHSNAGVQIVGLNKTNILKNINVLEPEYDVLLHYSPLPIPSKSLM